MKKATLIVFFSALAQSFAGPIEELRVVSSLPAFELKKLQEGDIVTNRGPLGKFSRGIYGEIVYFVHAPMAVTGERRLRWDAAKYPELDVRMLRQYAWPAPPATWDALNLKWDQADDRRLMGKTLQLGSKVSELNVTETEIAAFRAQAGNTTERDSSASDFWRKVLRSRSEAVASGGLAALPSYSAGGVQINPRSEFESLMKMAPSITGRFAPLIKGRPFTAGSSDGAGEILPHWGAGLVRGHTNLQLGFRAARKSADSWQLANCNYYVSDSYFFSVTLYEMFAMESGTLVWQIDFASVPFRNLAGGVDKRLVSGQMLRRSTRSARLFRNEIQNSR